MNGLKQVFHVQMKLPQESFFTSATVKVPFFSFQP